MEICIKKQEVNNTKTTEDCVAQTTAMECVRIKCVRQYVYDILVITLFQSFP